MNRVERIVVTLAACAAMTATAAPSYADGPISSMLLDILRADDAFFPDAEFLVGVEIMDLPGTPTAVTVTTGGGMVVELEHYEGEGWDEEVDFPDLETMLAAMHGTWTVDVDGDVSSVSTFTLEIDDFNQNTFFATPTDLFPPNGAEDVPADVVLSWSDPTGEVTADVLGVCVGDELEEELCDDNIFGTLDITDTSWDPPGDLSPGFQEFDVAYVAFGDDRQIGPFSVDEGTIDWGPHPYAPKGYPAESALFVFGSATIVGFQVAGGCPQDLDGSGAVDFGDILEVLVAWGECGGCPQDLDGSGVVDFADILEILVAWGPCP